MNVYKTIILTFIFFLCSLPVLPNSTPANNNVSEIISIDTLQTQIKGQGWNNTLLEHYRNYLININNDFNTELTELNNFSESFQIKYLKSVILKRQGKFQEMAVLLFDLLKQNTDFIPYYDDLIYAAFASKNDQLLINNVVNQDYLKPFYRKYILAMIEYNNGNYSKTINVLNTLAKEKPGNKYLLYHLSYAYRNAGNYVEALNEINNAISNSGSDNYFLAEAYLAMGSLQFLSGNYSSAQNYYSKAHTLSKSNKNKYSESTALVDLGIIEDQNGDIEKAREYYTDAIDITEAYNFPELSALAYSELGVSYSFTSELLKAKKNYLKSYALYKELGNKLRLSLLSDNIAKLYLSQFNFIEAEKLYKEGLDFAGENKRAQAINLTGLADVYANLSNYSKALEYYLKAKEITSQIKEIGLEIEINSGLGSLNFNLDNFNRAFKYFKDANELSLQSSDPYSIAESYHNLGLTYSRLDSIKQSEYNLKQAVDVSSEYNDPYTCALSLIDLAYIYRQTGEFTKSFSFLEKAKKISTENSFVYLFEAASVLEGKIYESKNDLRKAESIYSNSLSKVKSINELNLEIELHYLLAGLYAKDKRYLSAESEYKNAIKIIERISRSLYAKDQVQISYFSAKSEIYNSYAELLINQKKYKEAYLVIDRSRSRNTIQNLFNLKIENFESNNNSLDNLYDYEWIINSGLYSQAEVDSVRIIYNNYRSSMVKKHPQFREMLSGDLNYSVADIQNKLGKNEYLVSYYFTDKKLFIVLLNRDEFKSFLIDITKKQLLADLAKISPYFGTGANKIFFNQDLFSFNTKYSFQLFKKLLEPVTANIPHGSKIIFSPCPELAVVPLEFLVTKYDKNISSYNYTNTSFLVDDYQVSYTPSVKLYINEKENLLVNNGKILILGNPVINNQQGGFSERRGMLEESTGLPRNFALLPLKYSADEINEIGAMINADKILLANDATETKFKLNAEYSKIIHLSTHSFLLNNQPVIFLSNYYDTDNDGLLESSEIVKMKLNSDLVVLSSCNSGLGEIDQSEGIMGMTKAFYEAGVKSVVVSLWPVNDKYTSKFMALFYENLANGMNKSEALRKAKIIFIKKYSANPYYWSAFVLSGNTSGINIQKKSPLNLLLVALLGIMLMAVMFIYIKNKRIPV